MLNKRKLEKEFTFNQVVPLLKKLGLEHVRYVHGMDEYGRDIVFYDTDKFGIQKLYGAQVKYGDLSGSAKSSLNTIINQVDDALKMPFFDTLRGEEKQVSGLYLIISGIYKRNAKEKIRTKCLSKPIYFIDGNDLSSIENRHSEKSKEYTNREINKLVREARASMRCCPVDLASFENKLHQIGLLDESSSVEKVEALSEIGLEVTLNSSKGTELLVDELMWTIAGGDDNPQIATIDGVEKSKILLDLIATTLWEWGVQAVEYQRIIEPVQVCTNALLRVLAIAKNLRFDGVTHSCKSAIDSMYAAAIKDKVKNLVQFLLSVKRG